MKNIFLLSSTDLLIEELRAAAATEILKRGNSVAYISSAPQTSDHVYYDKTIDDFRAIDESLQIEYFDLSDAFSDQQLATLVNYPAIYLSGGNTFTFMGSARKRGLQKILEKYLASGGLIIGASAGSIMCTPTIEIAAEADPNEVDMTDFTGFAFVDFEFHPHFVDGEDEIAWLTEYHTKTPHRIYTCRDGSGIHVTDRGNTFIGAVNDFFA